MRASQHEAMTALRNRRSALDTEFNAWKPHFEELRENILPTRGRFHVGENRKGSTINKKIIDSAGRKALRTLKSGLMAGMTSPSRPWFRLGIGIDGAMDDPAVKEWAHLTQTRMYDVLRASNVYGVLNTCYGDLGLYGTFCGLIVSNFDDVIRCHSYPMGLFRIAEGEHGFVDVMHRECKMTVAQVVEKFGLENCSINTQSQFRTNNLYSWVDVEHVIEPRRQHDPMSPLSSQKPIASYYFEKGEDTFLQVSGFDRNPILAPRWEPYDGEAFSASSPGMDALGDCVQLQQQQIDKAKAIQKSYNPPLMGGSGSPSSYRNIPGGVSVVQTNDLQRGGLRPIYDVRPDIQGLLLDIDETRTRIRESFFADLFLMTSMSDRRQITAREIAERHEEKLLALGPVLESLNHGLLQPVIENTFHHMVRVGIVPPAPRQIEGAPIKAEYISLLAQAQKAIGVAAIERTIGFAATLEQLRPGAMDIVDTDRMLREFAEQVGPPPAVLHTEDEVQQARQARAQKEQMQEALAATGWQINNNNQSPRGKYYENVCAKGTFFQSDGKIIQTVWGGGAGLTDGELYENYTQTKAVNAFRVTGDTSGTIVRDNDLHGLVEQLTDIPNFSGFSDLRRNFACGDGSAGVGVDGLEIDIRNGTSAADVYWENGFPAMDASLYDLLAPAEGQPTHWDYPGQKVGATLLKRHKLVDGGAHVGENWGWPRARKFRDTWNFDDKISTSFNGQLDSEGNNASGAPIPTYPVISASSQILVTVS